MADKKFSQFSPVATGSTMVVVGLKDGLNAKSSAEILLLDKATYDALSGKVDQNASDISTLNQKVNGIEGDLATTDGKVAALELDMSTAESNILALTGDLDTAEATITSQGQAITTLGTELDTAEQDITDLTSALAATDQAVADLDAATAKKTDIPTRKRTWVRYTAVNLTLTSAAVNILDWLAAETPSTGTLTPFFNAATGKMNVFNDDASCVFKVILVGTWTGSNSNRAIELNISELIGNRHVVNRTDVSTDGDDVTISSFLSVEKDSPWISSGITMTLRSLGGNYTVTEVIINVEQTTAVADVTPA